MAFLEDYDSYSGNGSFSNNLANADRRAAASSSGRGGPLDAVFSDLQAAEGEASAILAAAYENAAAAIGHGQEAAAQATIEAAEIAAASVLESAQIADTRIRDFFNQSKQYLLPIIEQGNYANDEIASMLGIRNSKGDVVPFDLSVLEETPGYQFQLEQGSRAVENSAVGQRLSGAQVKAQEEFGQGLAAQYFDRRIQQLGLLGTQGTDAAQSLAQAATSAGANAGQVFSAQGAQLSSVYNNQGNNLANIYSSGGESLANLALGVGAQQAGLVTDLASLGGNLSIAQLNADNTRSIANKQSNNDLIGDITTGLATYYALS